MKARAMVVACVVLAFAAPAVQAQLKVKRSVLASGASLSSSAGYGVHATVAQPVTGAGGSSSYSVWNGFWHFPTPMGTAVGDAPAASVFGLGQNYPNPFNPLTTIAFTIPADAWVQLRVYDVTGAEVLRPLDRALPRGAHRVTLDARTLASGVYFYRLDAAGKQQTRKFVLLK